MVLDLLGRALRAVGKRIVSYTELGVRLIVAAASVVRAAVCPNCRRRSRALHGRYWRRVAERCVLGRPVTLEIEIRRFRCHNMRCGRKTFAEPVTPLAGARQRRTVALAAAHCAIALQLGGAAGARLAAALGMRASGDTLLRTLRRSAAASAPSTTPPARTIGIDDWAFARGHRYGSIVVDLERRCPLDLLPDREADTAAAWLAAHPNVEVVARDRAGAYAEAAARTVPAAVQVADRFHLIGNARDALERVLVRSSPKLQEAARELEPQPATALAGAVAAGTISDSDPAPAQPALSGRRRQAAAESRVQASRARRFARYEEVVRLRAAGMSIGRIARTCQLDRRTVRKFIRAGRFPERAERCAMPSQLDPHREHLQQRVADGCTNAAQLWREIAAAGFAGCYRSVQRAVSELRGYGTTHPAIEKPVSVNRSVWAPSPRRACAWLLGWNVRRGQPEHNAEVRQRYVERLSAIAPEIGVAREALMQFIAMLRSRNAAAFDHWLARARTSTVVEVRRFAGSLAQDLQAVRAAVSTAWSSGQVEGQINRLKMLKRQMYGRAKLDLLRIRVLVRA